jgi:AcrR family transcriptional regulator
MAIDRRVQRTRTALYDALVRLIRRKPYSDISVEDVLVEADIGRSTFYAHFRSMDDLLDRSLDRLKALLQRAIGEAELMSPAGEWDCTRVLFDHVGEYRDIHATLADNRGGEVLQAALARVLAEVLREALPRESQAGLPRELAVQFVVSTFATVLGYWFGRQPERPAAEAEAMFRHLVGRGLGAAA